MLMDISKILWIFLYSLESYGHLIERESLEASKELYKRSSPQAWSNLKEATNDMFSCSHWKHKNACQKSPIYSFN